MAVGLLAVWGGPGDRVTGWWVLLANHPGVVVAAVCYLHQVGVLGRAAWCLSPVWGPWGVATLTRLVTKIVLHRVLVLCGALGHNAWSSCCVGPGCVVWSPCHVWGPWVVQCDISIVCGNTVVCSVASSPEWDLGSYCMGPA